MEDFKTTGGWVGRHCRRFLFSERWPAGCLFFLIIAFGWYAADWQVRETDAALRQRWLSQAIAVAQTISPEEVAGLSFTKADQLSPRFVRLRGHLLDYGRLLPEVRWIYTMVKRDDQIVFGADNLAYDDPDGWDPPGELYDRPPPELMPLFGRHDGLVLGPYTDEYGSYVSAFAPVLNPQDGAVMMVVGLDVMAEQWQAQLRHARMGPVLLTLALLLLLLVGLRAMAWRERLPWAAQGRWNHLETWLAVVFGLAFTLEVAYLVDGAATRRAQRNFEQLAEKLAESIRSQCVQVRDQVIAAARLVATRPELDQAGFQKLIQPMIQFLPVAEMKWLARGDQLGGFPGSASWWPEVFEAAVASDLVVATAPVELPGAQRNGKGVLIGQSIATGDDGAGPRRSVVLAGLRLPTLFETALSRTVREGNDQIYFEILDLSGHPTMPVLLASYPRNGAPPMTSEWVNLERHHLQPLFAFGRTYVLAAHPGRGGVRAHFRHDGLLAGLAGVLLTASLTIFVGFLRERRLSLEGLVRERTAALAEGEQRYRAFMDSTSDLAFIKDAACRYLFVNRANREFFGRPESAILGLTDAELMPSSSVANCLRTDRLVLDQHRLVVGEERIESRIFNVCKFPLPLRDGHDGIGGLVRDITELRQADEHRLELERQLLHNQKLESLGVMAGGITHDFNNLLASIQGNAELALLQLPRGGPPEEIAKSLNGVLLAAKSAAGLTKQLMAYVGKTQTEMQVVDLNRLLIDNAAMLRSAIGKSIELYLAPATEVIEINADPNQIQQVVMNLLTNAAEAMAKGHGGSITLSSGIAECDATMLARSRCSGHAGPGRYAWLEIADQGCGMDEATQRRMFDPFFTTKETGHGLGMSAMLGIVRHHRGAILVDSVVDQGTVIRTLFPVSTPLPASAVTMGEEALPSAAGQLSGTVMVVDDDAMFRSFCATLIESFGCRVLTADGGREAVEQCRREPDGIDCVILDLVMPEMDGVAVFDQLLALAPPMPVIICSGLSRRDAESRLGMRSPAGFIQKPFEFSILKTVLGATLEARLRNSG